MRQSGNPTVVGLTPAGVEKLEVGQTFSDRVIWDFISLALYFPLHRRLNWVAGIRRAYIVDDSTLSAYYPQLSNDITNSLPVSCCPTAQGTQGTDNRQPWNSNQIQSIIMSSDEKVDNTFEIITIH